MRNRIFILTILLIPVTAQAASSIGSALFGITLGAVAGIYAMPYVLPSAIETAPIIVGTLSNASAALGETIIANPTEAAGIIGGFFGFLLAP